MFTTCILNVFGSANHFDQNNIEFLIQCLNTDKAEKYAEALYRDLYNHLGLKKDI